MPGIGILASFPGLVRSWYPLLQAWCWGGRFSETLARRHEFSQEVNVSCVCVIGCYCSVLDYVCIPTATKETWTATATPMVPASFYVPPQVIPCFQQGSLSVIASTCWHAILSGAQSLMWHTEQPANSSSEIRSRILIILWRNEWFVWWLHFIDGETNSCLLISDFCTDKHVSTCWMH